MHGAIIFTCENCDYVITSFRVFDLNPTNIIWFLEVVDTTGADLVTCIRQLNPSIEQLECSVFDGEYVTGSVDAAYLDHLKGIRSDNMKTKVTVVNGLASAQATAILVVVVVTGVGTGWRARY
ncbi:hypothetical protein EDB85DRAFT_1891775 [Lactarius pseudohatsudake]|nr:hypothetical protein EDB85DRAFT_1891775 [Lactarius pseudohatsudake]